MSTSSLPHDSLEKEVAYLFKERLSYQNSSKNAAEEGNNKLAARWDFLIELVSHFLKPHNPSLDIPSTTQLIKPTRLTDRTIEVQEVAHYTTTSLTAIASKNIMLAQQLMRHSQETQQVAILTRQWIAFFKNQIASYQLNQKLHLRQIAISYRNKALEASQAGQGAIAQQWAEAACLIQEAAAKKTLSENTYITFGNGLLHTYWNLLHDAFNQASQLRTSVALALEQGNNTLAKQQEELALLAEKLTIDREHLVLAMIDNKNDLAIHWKNSVELLSKELERRLAAKAAG